MEKFIGDAVVGLFGAPLVHEDDAERAVRAALSIRDWARNRSDLVVADRRRDRAPHSSSSARASRRARAMVVGDVVDDRGRACRSRAPPGCAVVDRRTHRATEAVSIAYRPLAALRGEGGARAPVGVLGGLRFAVTGPPGIASPTRADARRSSAAARTSTWSSFGAGARTHERDGAARDRRRRAGRREDADSWLEVEGGRPARGPGGLRTGGRDGRCRTATAAAYWALGEGSGRRRHLQRGRRRPGAPGSWPGCSPSFSPTQPTEAR